MATRTFTYVFVALADGKEKLRTLSIQESQGFMEPSYAARRLASTYVNHDYIRILNAYVEYASGVVNVCYDRHIEAVQEELDKVYCSDDSDDGTDLDGKTVTIDGLDYELKLI